MTKIVWDEVGERRYETGIDRGVLYLPASGAAVPWNGLTSVAETKTRETKTYHIDGIQYLAHNVPASYAAKLQAFTYPIELEELLGVVEFATGVFLHDQRAKMFNLSYRTRIGNDLEGEEYGYKIHVIYNVMASPSDFTHGSLSDSPSVAPFEWNLVAVPPLMVGEARPTSHISFDSRWADLTAVETWLYGNDEVDPALPSLVDMLAMFV